MTTPKIDRLIITSPYEEPKQHWRYQRESQQFELTDGRRKAGYWRATQNRRRYNPDDPGEFVEIELVNRIRPRVREWAQQGYPGVTGTTKKLLEHWQDADERQYPFFWCQLEAVETAIWLTESSPASRQGIDIPKDGEWERQCLKLATGTGKTTVMAMLIAWQVLNKVANPRDARFTKQILILAPGITVRDRLRVLKPEDRDSFYKQFSVVPNTMSQELYTAKIEIMNWHALAPLKENQGPKVIKKGPESDEAFFRRVLPEFGNVENILIINDEAHHCHRPEAGEDGNADEEATVWVSGIDRLHRARTVLKAFDLSATPFKPSGHENAQEALFPWIVSDFGLNDAIESGLVKTPKVAVRDDSKVSADFKSRLYHIYPEVRDDLNRGAEENEGLPDLVSSAIDILGADWLKEREKWHAENQNIKVPPVLIAICNRVETAARVEYAIMNGYTAIHELADRERLIRVDEDALGKIESEEAGNMSGTKRDAAELLREKLNTVGKEGRAGEQVQCVIGVNMLSEGWDARTVTHILGLRAFTSQLLCEQVVGRGLRRLSYDLNDENGLFDPEYVTVFGVPFTFLPVEQEGGKKVEGKPKTKIEPLADRSELEIGWPHVVRVEYKLSYFLNLDWSKLTPLVLSPDNTPTIVELAPIIDGKADPSRITKVDLQKLAEQNRLQTSKLQSAARLREKFKDNWRGDAGSQIGQLMVLLDQFIESDKLIIKVPHTDEEELYRRVLIATNIQSITEHLGQFIRVSSGEKPTPIFDHNHPVRSTATAPTWYTTKPTQPVKKSQISHIVSDSGWEARVALELERPRIPKLVSWAKNDHLGFEIYYVWQGHIHPYFPDFLIKFEDGRTMILEVKGQKTDQDKAKWAAAEEWVRAVNENGNFGVWEFKVLEDPKDLFDIVK